MRLPDLAEEILCCQFALVIFIPELAKLLVKMHIHVVLDPPGSLSYKLCLHRQVLGLAPHERNKHIAAFVVGCPQAQPAVPPLKTKH
ncbi:hypothetical protein DPMN_035174 [Dreissena polymorpha]|uniref:Uncharacterized protein n=1 Tax=Dreissena polymorpha TaxID=45954 RepID=A0A9D4MA23_DREPO|nr:hypothetical protein DPMN_035174 [Dreissena polymorpha]